MPGAVRHVDDVGGPDVDDQPGEDGVDRVRRRVVQIERSEARAFGVRHVPDGAVAVGALRDRALHARVGRRRGDALLEGRREHVGLERGPRRVLGRDRVDLVLLVVAAAEHRADRPRVRAERHDRDIGLRRVARVLRRARPRGVRGLLRGLLPVGVERRDDVEPAFGQRPLALLRGAAQHRVPAVRVIDDLLLHVVDEERRRRQTRARRRWARARGGVLGPLPAAPPTRRRSPGRARSCGSARRCGEASAACGCAIGLYSLGPLFRPASSAASGSVRVRRRLMEVEARGGADPVDVVPEEDLVQVELEDLVLRVVLLDALGERQLLELARKRYVVGAERVLHELLRDRRAALGDLAGADVLDQRAERRGQVERAVFVEASRPRSRAPP